MSEQEVLTQVQGHLGLITLNRPKAVNALSYTMIGLLQEALDTFEADENITVVALTGAGDRGFCAGGDVVSLYRQAKEDPVQAGEFFREEYQLDYRISEFPKPVVALMNGLVLGGGVGLAGPSSNRVVTDSTRLGMPETGIGFSPDVAGAYYLAQAPGLVGRHLATTGLHINGPDALFAGLGDYYVEDEKIPALLQELGNATDTESVGRIIENHTNEAPASQLEKDAEWIDRVYDADSVEQIITNLAALAEQRPDHPAGQALKALRRNSPTGVKVAFEAVQRARELSIAETLHMDFRTTMNAMVQHDLVEGIRAQLIDKDRNPTWDPATYEAVSNERVSSFFEPIPGVADLELQL